MYIYPYTVVAIGTREKHTTEASAVIHLNTFKKRRRKEEQINRGIVHLDWGGGCPSFYPSQARTLHTCERTYNIIKPTRPQIEIISEFYNLRIYEFCFKKRPKLCACRYPRLLNVSPSPQGPQPSNFHPEPPPRTWRETIFVFMSDRRYSEERIDRYTTMRIASILLLALVYLATTGIVHLHAKTGVCIWRVLYVHRSFSGRVACVGMSCTRNARCNLCRTFAH